LAETTSPDDFHKWAKDAGNKLRAYILSYASGATAVFFLALAGKDVSSFSAREQGLLITALVLFVLTAILCLFELHIDARRFFYVAKQLELPDDQRSWGKNDWYKKVRLRLIFGSYLTASLATAAVVVFLIHRIA
jgi:hypothetical protein